MAKAAAEGVKEVEGTEVLLRRVPETLTKEVIEKMKATQIQMKMADVPICTVEELGSADAVIFGTPTRFGNMCGQMRQFLDSTGQLWLKGSLLGKVAGVFTSSSSQHGGQESTVLSFFNTLLHHGMIIAGLPYSYKGMHTVTEVSGCSPYGATTIAATDNSRQPSKIELEGAKFQGRHIAQIAKKLTGK
jgi:NAD(P)H dehydrogenase (quinone)